ncbi:MAG: hypothetical protein L3J44_06605, partial [Campylobacteraceae bacterium]|nr:hypothetical protein [Campylobacteraceae bacterium]
IQNILKRAFELQIPVCVGTDTHHVRYYGLNFKESLEYINRAGNENYVSYSKLIPEKRTIFDDHELKVKYTSLNKGIEFLNQRLRNTQRRICSNDFSRIKNTTHTNIDVGRCIARQKIHERIK